jgi:hypothetical protein
LEIKLGVLSIRNHPRTLCLCGLWGLFRDDQLRNPFS